MFPPPQNALEDLLSDYMERERAAGRLSEALVVLRAEIWRTRLVDAEWVAKYNREQSDDKNL